MKKLSVILISFLAVFNAYGQKIDTLAQTPPMGWNTWNTFGCDVSAELIKETADAIVESGLKEAGYEYVVIDDCWHGERDTLGFIHPDPELFPNGMKAVADYVHSKGLKFGIYSDAGTETCAGRPGSRGHEYQDAHQYAKWKVDYLKYDWCNTGTQDPAASYKTMRDALYASGRPITLSICEWGDNDPWKWGAEMGHLWRTTGDIYNCWDCEYDHGSWSSWGVLRILDMQDGLRKYAGPGHWNDPDMMEVGNGMSEAEDRSHFSMWCMLAAPLMAGNDVRDMSQETTDILTNKEAIAINQDTMGVQGFKYTRRDSMEVWFKPLAQGDWAACFLNRNDHPVDVEFNWDQHVVKDTIFDHTANFKEQNYKLRDVWKQKDLGSTEKPLIQTIGTHDVVMLRLKKD